MKNILTYKIASMVFFCVNCEFWWFYVSMIYLCKWFQITTFLHITNTLVGCRQFKGEMWKKKEKKTKKKKEKKKDQAPFAYNISKKEYWQKDLLMLILMSFFGCLNIISSFLNFLFPFCVSCNFHCLKQNQKFYCVFIFMI